MQKTLEQVQAERDLKLAREATTGVANKLFAVLGKSGQGSDTTLQTCNKLLALGTEERKELISDIWGPYGVQRAEPLLYQLESVETRQKFLEAEYDSQFK